MKKISLDQISKELNMVESSTDVIKKINGGCKIQVGRCLNDGSYYIMDVIVGCSNNSVYTAHVADIMNQAKRSNMARGSHRIFTSTV